MSRQKISHNFIGFNQQVFTMPLIEDSFTADLNLVLYALCNLAAVALL